MAARPQLGSTSTAPLSNKTTCVASAAVVATWKKMKARAR